MPGDPTVIEAGMALAWNPSIVGVKLEDTTVVETGGPRVVTVGAPVLSIGPGSVA